MNFFGILVLCFALSEGEECVEDKPCIIKDAVAHDKLVELKSSSNISSKMPTTEATSSIPSATDGTVNLPSTTTIPSSTLPSTPLATEPVPATTTPKPTMSPIIASAELNKICWCDLTVNVCDVNCCCDHDCSFYQKLIFTHCTNLHQRHDPNKCYSSNFLFKKPSAVKTEMSDGLFCIVKDNIAFKKEFKPRGSVQTIEEFDSILRKRQIVSFRQRDDSPVFSTDSYRGGNLLWLIQKEKFVPFDVPSQMYGDLCLSKMPIKFLENGRSLCKIPMTSVKMGCPAVLSQFLTLLSFDVITNPLHLNASDLQSSVQNCSSLNACRPISASLCKNIGHCVKLKNTSSILNPKTCNNLGLIVKMHIMHNGTDGITAVNASITIINQKVLDITVSFLWADDENIGFVKSGNPGYLQDRPVLAGRKVILTFNDSSISSKEGIELTSDPAGWLNTFQAKNGECSVTKREPVLFNRNQKRSCVLFVNKTNFSVNGCLELQQNALKILLGEDNLNVSSVEFNKYLGIFGNSKVEHIYEWVKVMMDSFQIVSNPAYFNNDSTSLICKNIFLSVFIDIAVAKFGSFYDPQLKILGALITFGEPTNIIYPCIMGQCSVLKSIKIKSHVNFLDISRPAVREFAHPPGLEAKLPHDFFYPFFSGIACNLKSNILIILVNACGLMFCL